MADIMGCLGRTALREGTILYRGYGDASVIQGFDAARQELILDRITSFTPFEEIAREMHGPRVCAVVLHTVSAVFCDDSACSCARGCRPHMRCGWDAGKALHCGDLGIEVQLLPGQYRVVHQDGIMVNKSVA
jgi:hypothetical protein